MRNKMKINWYRLAYCAIIFLIDISVLLFYLFFVPTHKYGEIIFETTTTTDWIIISLLTAFALSFSIFIYFDFSIHDYLYMIGLGNPISKKEIEKEYRNEMNCKMAIQLSKIRRCRGIDKISTTFYSKAFSIAHNIAKYASIILLCITFIWIWSPDSHLGAIAIVLLSTYPILSLILTHSIQGHGSKIGYKAYALDLKITKSILERKVDRTNKHIIINSIKLYPFYHSLIALLEKETKDIESILKKRDFSMYKIPYGKYESFVFNEFKDEIKDFTKCFVGYIFYQKGIWTDFIYDKEWKGYDMFRYLNKDKNIIFI